MVEVAAAVLLVRVPVAELGAVLAHVGHVDGPVFADGGEVLAALLNGDGGDRLALLLDGLVGGALLRDIFIVVVVVDLDMDSEVLRVMPLGLILRRRYQLSNLRALVPLISLC